MTALDFLIIGLATWRLAYMVTHEAGPLHVFRRVRERFPTVNDGGVGELLHCQYCASVWTGLACVALWLAGAHLVNVVLAASALGLAIASYTGLGDV